MKCLWLAKQSLNDATHVTMEPRGFHARLALDGTARFYNYRVVSSLLTRAIRIDTIGATLAALHDCRGEG